MRAIPTSLRKRGHVIRDNSGNKIGMMSATVLERIMDIRDSDFVFDSTINSYVYSGYEAAVGILDSFTIIFRYGYNISAVLTYMD